MEVNLQPGLWRKASLPKATHLPVGKERAPALTWTLLHCYEKKKQNNSNISCSHLFSEILATRLLLTIPFPRSILLDLTLLPTSAKLTQTVKLFWASSHVLHFSVWKGP